MHFVLLLTFVAAFAGSTVEQKIVPCGDLACVAKLRDEALAAPSCTRVRVWAIEDYAPVHGLRAFVWPPYMDWQKG